MIDKQREDDDVEDKDQDKEQSGDGEQTGSGGIHKYFGKSNKQPKFFNSKVKKMVKSGPFQNLSVLLQSNLKCQRQFDKIHQKTKAKLQYKWWSNYLNAKPKIKFTLNPFSPNKIFQDVVLNWKSIVSKFQDQNYEIKYNQKNGFSLKYKRTKFYMEKKLRHRLESQIASDGGPGLPGLRLKSNVSLESLLKVPFFQTHQYLNSGQFKSKLSFNALNLYNKRTTTKLDLTQKLTYIINEYKLKQESKLNFSLGQKNQSTLKSTLQITNPTNVWTLYGSLYGKKWGVDFDQLKILYSIYGEWKFGLMLGQKNNWQVSLQNLKMNRSLCTSFGIHVGNKNYALIMKNRFNKKQYGKINYQLSIQNSLNNTSLDKVNVGINLNCNL